MNFKQFLSEMPITGFHHLGDWEPENKPTNAYNQRRAPRKGYYKDDYGILTNPAGIEKIGRKWSKSGQPFNISVYRSTLGPQIREVGEVTREFLANTLKLSQEDIAKAVDENSINIIYTNNIGAERQVFNWWTMAHRVGHAVRRIEAYQEYRKNFRRELEMLLDEVYNHSRKERWQERTREDDKMLLALANGLGTMRSARERLLRNIEEFYHEVLAQYIIEGRVKFNKVPDMLVTRFNWGRPAGKYSNRDSSWSLYIEQLEDGINYHLKDVLMSCIGAIFVM